MACSWGLAPHLQGCAVFIHGSVALKLPNLFKFHRSRLMRTRLCFQLPYSAAAVWNLCRLYPWHSHLLSTIVGRNLLEVFYGDPRFQISIRGYTSTSFTATKMTK
ncbi:hypothetical protein F5B19DRAFT_449490 [Rostrohypoxylon terebratum]|nr:hypothetical protein F5B19DRAFT_449490 [Rostrohypoxylon terebratum]